MFPGKELAASWSPEKGCLCKYVAFSLHVALLAPVRGTGEEIQCRGLPRAHLYLQILAIVEVRTWSPGRVVPAPSAGSSCLNFPNWVRSLPMHDVWTYENVGPL